MFDEMVWEEFDESGDHIVPETESLTKDGWTFKAGESPCAAISTKEESFGEQNALPCDHRFNERGFISQEQVSWSDLTSSSTSVIDHKDRRESNLADYGWGTTTPLEDMDKLFLDENDALLSQAFNDGGDNMLWESSSSIIGGSAGNMYQSIKPPMTLEVRAFADTPNATLTSRKLENNGANDKTLPSYHDNVSVQNKSTPCAQEDYSAICLHNVEEKPLVKPTDSSEVPCTGSELMIPTAKHAEKASKPRQHATRHFRRTEGQRAQKMSSIHLSPTSHKFPPPPMTVSQTTQSSLCKTPSSIQATLPVPCVNASFGFPVHHMAIMTQQVYGLHPSYHSPALSTPQLVCENNKGFPQRPTGSPNMTPQEKIEKLRWRQKMQAQMAVEQQQYQLIKQHSIPSPKPNQMSPLNCENGTADTAMRHVSSQIAEPLAWNEGPVSEPIEKKEEEDESLAANVLQQLLDVAVELDDRFRQCLQDGFHRLAKSAMQRQALSECRGNGGGIFNLSNRDSTDTSRCKRIFTVADIVETETNPIDRFIAHLLFYKQYPSPIEPTYADQSDHMAESSSYEKHWTLQPSERIRAVAEPSTVSSGLPAVREASNASLDSLAFNNIGDFLPTNNSLQKGPLSQSKAGSLVEGSLVDGHRELDVRPKCFSGFDSIESKIEKDDVRNKDVAEMQRFQCTKNPILAAQMPSREDEAPRGEELEGVKVYHLNFTNAATFDNSLLDVKEEVLDGIDTYTISSDLKSESP